MITPGSLIRSGLLLLAVVLLTFTCSAGEVSQDGFAVETPALLGGSDTFGDGQVDNAPQDDGSETDPALRVDLLQTAEDAPYTFVTAWGSYGTDDGQFNNPIGIAINSAGDVYVTDYYNDRIQKFDSSGTFLGKWGMEGTDDGQFNSPSGVAVDSIGNVYVADTENHRIQKFDSSGTFLGKWGSYGTGNGQFIYPNGVAVDASGNVYVADASNNRIQKFDSSSTFLGMWGSWGTDDGQLKGPTGIAIDSSGFVYVSDYNNHRIQKFDSSGIFLGKWGNWGTDDRQFKGPIGITIDSSGFVYVTDASNDRIQKFDSSGTFLGKWGSLGTGDEDFNYPTGIAVDSIGNVYVSDYNNHRIQKFALRSSAIPIANFTANTVAGPVPLAVQFTDLSTGSPTTWTTIWNWAFGDGGSSTLQHPVHTFTAAGNYTVSLTVTNAAGADSLVKNGFIVVEEGAAPVYYPANGHYYEDIAIQEGITWIDAERAARSRLYQGVSGYLATITSQEENDFILNNLGGASAIDGYGLGGFQAPGSEEPAGGWQWVTGEEWIYTHWHSKEPNNYYGGDFGIHDPGWHEEALHFHYGTGVWNDIPEDVPLVGYIVEYPVQESALLPLANLTANVSSGCAPLTVAFTDTSSGNVTSWLWDFGDGSSSTQQHPVHIYTAAGNYTVTLTVTNADGADTFNRTGYITVSASPPVPVANFTANTTRGCISLTVAFTDLSAGDLTSWNWTFGDGEMSIDQHPVHTYTVAGNYTISLTVAGTGGSDTFTRAGYITVTDLPAYQFFRKWGSQGSGDGQFKSPWGIVVDADGYVYTGDGGNHRVQKFDSSGNFITKWGSQGSGDGQFSSPGGVAVDSDRNVYVVDFGNHRIQKFDSAGNFLMKWGSQGSGDGQFYGPQGIAVDSIGNIYVADTWNNRIQKFDSAGTFITKWGSFNAPLDVKVDLSGYVYVADTFNDRIQKFDSAGNYITRWGSTGSADGQFNRPRSVAIDAAGYVYIADDNNNRIQLFDSSGRFLTKWGSTGSASGQFSSPYGITVSTNGSVYVIEFDNNRVQQFVPAGESAPVANFTANVTSGYDPLKVAFTDTSSGNVTSWLWDFGDGGSSTLQHPVHTYTVAGNYTVSLTVSDGVANSTATKEQYIRVQQPLPSAQLIFNVNYNRGTVNDTLADGTVPCRLAYHTGVYNLLDSPGNISGNMAFVLNASGITSLEPALYAELNGTQATWTFPPSTAIVPGMTLSTSATTSTYAARTSGVTLKRSCNRTIFTEPGVQEVTLNITFDTTELTDLWGRLECSDTGDVRPAFIPGTISTDLPLIDISEGSARIQFTINRSLVEAGRLYTLSCAVAVDPLRPVSYSPTCAVWEVMGRTSADAPSGTAVTLPAELHPQNVSHVAFSSTIPCKWSCVRNDQVISNLRQRAVPITLPVANFTANVTSGNAPLTVQFTDISVGEPTEWSWDFGDGSNSTEQHPVYEYVTAGNYTVNLTVTNAAGSNTMTRTGYISVRGVTETNTISVLPSSAAMTVGQTQAFTLVLDNASAGLAGCNVTVRLTNSSIGEIIGVQYPSWASLPANSTVPADMVWCKAADLTGTSGTANIALVTVTVRADAAGATNITVVPTRVEDRQGGRYEPAVTEAEITVTAVLPLPNPSGGFFPAPTDPNGDGRYEDLDGNGWIGFNDVVVYYTNLEGIDAGTYGPVSLFDYDNNGWAGFNDVVRLYEMIA